MKIKIKIFTLIILVLAFYVLDEFSGFEFQLSTPSEQGALEVYFCPRDNCEQRMIEYIELASDIKCAFYDLNLYNLTATLEKYENQIYVFEDEYNGFGTPVKSRGLMHNKFCILDGKAILTGSMNPTFNGNFKNNNNLLYIESKTLAKNYLKEHEELKTRQEKNTINKKIEYNDFEIENYFCPEDNCKEQVLLELNSAKESIYFMTFSFTDKEIGELLITKDKTINVTGLMEKKRINQRYNLYKTLNQTGMNITLDKNPNTMHHKVFIIDKKTVITGSYNPTNSANTKNDENILIIHNKDIAMKFLEEFERLTQ